ncbi:RNA recognition motif protein [Gregarina niphandrodes]|uniref:RNA recognition motif protein n=1 Tax=Gregarina niphandrodes TaxID=110365 RepID=A0A023AY54_GRENI|nr:RNA recognition motif protein [Gregarina niphandrodes]EZG43589.1 RNA recognition motif protein [Gregarina niphandrodes]|eukprot:XP_011133181.1 RNA recognition motif protein [Gregarina niphandrodes]
MDSKDRNRVYVGNLPDDVNSEDLTSELSKFGKVRDVDVKYGRTRNGSSYAFAEFADYESAEKAVAQSDETRILGVRVKIEFTGQKRLKQLNEMNKYNAPPQRYFPLPLTSSPNPSLQFLHP